ncbi:glycosyl hydrolase family 61-domain-containing protein [Ampelomyces quisqualis]|uniref:AA9 family lytic polysaccharide monooxygenase n=1 Tax=Ampelomyces quisqualis TaxID=50730 RepID=A0A6A5QV46_AMPQU|nr:glycosyl hydrolase family 61-domain-containing protein [Ampelomyces quisqualis]
MKTQLMLLAAVAAAPSALAHTVFTNFYVDGVSQGDGVAMRMSPYPETAGSPIARLDSKDMACNVGGTKGVSRVQPVGDGALLTFEIRGWANDPSKGSIDRGHYGPCAVYLKKVESAVNDEGAGEGWFKIFDHGYNASTKRWCTDEIIDNNGRLSVNVPKGLEGGDYLARPEILALHAANAGDPQTYTGCAQIFLESNGNLSPEKTVSIPGALTYEQEGTKWNIYTENNDNYPIPGPSVAKLVAKSNMASISSSSQSQGLKPEGCIAENANWCGKEVPSYSDEAGCWNAVDDCWAQSKVCWSSAPPTGGAGCKVWESKCTGLQDQCNGGSFNGPPKKGTVLTLEQKSIDVGQIMATVGGGMVDAPAPKTSETKKPETKTETPAQHTPAAEQNDNDDEPIQAPAKTTTPAVASNPSAPASKSSPAPAPKPTADNSYPAPPTADKEADDKDEEEEEEQEEEEDTPAPATTSATPSAPKPTKAPACVSGTCVTVTEIEVVTQTVYVTAGVGRSKRSLGSFQARRRWAPRA